MRRSFYKAAAISVAAYAAALVAGIVIDFRLTAFAVAALFLWGVFCFVRLLQLRRAGGHKPDALPDQSAGYGFALGATVFSAALLLAVVVLTQIV